LKNALLVRGLGLGFAAPIAMLIALSVVSYRTVTVSNAGTAWLLHTHQVLENVQDWSRPRRTSKLGIEASHSRGTVGFWCHTRTV
jgi:hypothetical protein